MPLHPQAQAFLDTINAMERTPLSELTPELARRGLQGLLPPQDAPIGAVVAKRVPARKLMAMVGILLTVTSAYSIWSALAT